MGHRHSSRGTSAAASDRAAIFVDYDNLYRTLRAQSNRGGSAADYTFEIFNEVRRYLEEGDDTPTTLAHAYADFVNLPDGGGLDVQDRLYSEGVDPVLTPAHAQANASELALCIDAATLLSERPDIGTVVIITGDRSFVPLVRSIRNSGRRALVAAVNPPPPGSTPSLGEDDAYLDARNLLSQSSRDDLTSGESNNRAPSRTRRSSPRRSAPTRERSAPSASPQRFRSIDNPMARRTVEITEEHFGQYKEVYLTPLLRKLSDVLGEQHDPKSLVSELEAAGAVRLEKRDGYPYDYTVLILNQDHPDVQEIQDEFYSNRTTGFNGSSDSYDDYDSYDSYDEDYEGGTYEESEYDEAPTYDDEHDEETPEAADDEYDEHAVDETQ
ncbi:NYN domain-containing protein [Longibacter salinarum]|uniref:NYN domain-containing protein n=1 Tax=Longibacter salinarum TaxID=1850348 RepID=A0A2A8D1T1_9BACT|nr:NYN domain-containing protein [Longibacter salinarum]PEN14767.1 NYN domain-containing protein [Longibacter salinarum]